MNLLFHRDHHQYLIQLPEIKDIKIYKAFPFERRLFLWKTEGFEFVVINSFF